MSRGAAVYTWRWRQISQTLALNRGIRRCLCLHSLLTAIRCQCGTHQLLGGAGGAPGPSSATHSILARNTAMFCQHQLYNMGPGKKITIIYRDQYCIRCSTHAKQPRKVSLNLLPPTRTVNESESGDESNTVIESMWQVISTPRRAKPMIGFLFRADLYCICHSTGLEIGDNFTGTDPEY
jgi:hypothetical protein